MNFESQRNPRNVAAGPDRLVAPAMQHGKQPFWARLELLTRLAFNARKHTANQPALLAQLDDGNDRAILVQGDEGSAQIVRLGHRGTPSIDVSDEIAILAARPHSISPLEGDGFLSAWGKYLRYHGRRWEKSTTR